MTRVRVEVKQDHLERLVQRSNPLSAVAELIWNSLDGDAGHVDVWLEQNDLRGISRVRVEDDGHGIAHKEALDAFRSLGNSWKKRRRISPEGRAYHGEKGQGRFTAFAIGGRVRWSTRWQDGDSIQRYEIEGDESDLRAFEVGEPVRFQNGRTGTEVEISNITVLPRALVAEDVPERLAELFAVYLLRHPEIQLRFDGKRVDPSEVQERVDAEAKRRRGTRGVMEIPSPEPG